MKMHPVKKIKVQESIKTDKKLFNAAQKHTDEDLMEIVDEETFESTPQSNMDLPLFMQGLGRTITNQRSFLKNRQTKMAISCRKHVGKRY